MPDGPGLERVFAPAKLNLTLQVFERTSAGYHRLRSVMAALALGDDVVVRRRPGPLSVAYAGAEIDPDADLVRAAAAAWGLSGDGCEVTIRKRVPLQSGLGGGSSDAAAAACALARAAGAPLDPSAVSWATIGSDVPFFARRLPGAILVDGVGDVTSVEAVSPPAWGIVLVQPGVRMPTAQAYALLDDARGDAVPADDGGERAQALLAAWRRGDFVAACQALHNDFSPVVETAQPRIADARTRLLAAGASATMLCGSGSCVAGFCPDDGSAEDVFARLSLGGGEWAAATSFWRGDG